MNRTERRRNNRTFKKNLETIDKLNPNQLRLIDIVATQKANVIATEKVKRFEDFIDRNITAAFLELDWDKDKILKFQNRVAELIEEDILKTKKLEDEGSNMKKIEDTVKKAVEEVLAEGLKKKDAIDKLVFKFPKLSKSMLTNAYQNIKDEHVTDKAVEYVFAEGVEEEKIKKELKEMDSKDVKAEVVVEKEVAKEDNKGLKILEQKVVKTIKVQGQNGIYTGKTEEGIVLTKDNATISFSNLEELEEWAKEFKTVFNML